MEKTLIFIKPPAINRDFIGEIIHRFERKGLQLSGMKMMKLNDKLLNEHYEHLKEKPFFQRIKDSMMQSPVIVCCWKGIDSVQVARTMTGCTNGRNAAMGTIRGDYSVSIQENIIHTSDSVENAQLEIKRFFKEDEIFEFDQLSSDLLYANDEF